MSEVYTLSPMESNFLKSSSILTAHSIELQFGMHIISYHRTHPKDFREYLMYSFFSLFAGVQKIILINYGLRSEILRSNI